MLAVLLAEVRVAEGVEPGPAREVCAAPLRRRRARHGRPRRGHGALEEDFLEVRQELTVEEGKVGEAALWLERRHGSTHQTVIRAPREARFVAKQTLEAVELRRLPGSGGDPLKMIENLPGIARSPYGGWFNFANCR